MMLKHKNGLEYKIADRRVRQWYKEVEGKEETANESVFGSITFSSI